MADCTGAEAISFKNIVTGAVTDIEPADGVTADGADA